MRTGVESPRKAHPRSRGENPALAARPATRRGSSPLTRGKRHRTAPQRGRRRLIPAHAGKTPGITEMATTYKAHPRSRGENEAGGGECRVVAGSSPLTRGKPRRSGRCTCAHRLIPAHAGKTVEEIKGGKKISAHPRSRGENRGDNLLLWRAAGSSPLTRGKRHHAHEVGQSGRLIPAHAGKTRRTPPWGGQGRAHPRSRGENGAVAVGPIFPHGSSPLTRGKRGWRRKGLDVRRLIPAHAGKTLPDLRFYRADRSDLGKP